MLLAIATNTAALAPVDQAASPSTDIPQTAPVKPHEEKKICRNIGELGSRLRRNRVCMTKQEWADQRMQDRMAIERSQMSACAPGGGC
jgi:hypothetical protein